jgi:hypothetical protein
MDTLIGDVASGSLKELLEAAETNGASLNFDFGDRHFKDNVVAKYVDDPRGTDPQIWTGVATTVEEACQKISDGMAPKG